MPAMHDRNRPKDELQQIRTILLREWDPIGIGDVPEAHDEYDSYVGDILAALSQAKATADIIAARLLQIATDDMALPNSPPLVERCTQAAERLMGTRAGRMQGKVSDRDPDSTDDHEWIRRFIAANLPILPVPDIPEICLHKAGPQSGLRRLAKRDPQFGSPYWAHYWGGGLVLARYLLDRPESVVGRRVLDLGAGSGIVSIAAAKSGAAEVRAADVDPYAMVAVELNTAANNVSFQPILADLTKGEPPDVDVICVGDLFYEAALAKRVTAFLDRCLDQGIAVLVGDPWRAHLPTSRLRLLAEYAVTDFGEDIGNMRRSGVFTLAGKSRR